MKPTEIALGHGVHAAWFPNQMVRLRFHSDGEDNFAFLSLDAIGALNAIKVDMERPITPNAGARPRDMTLNQLNRANVERITTCQTPGK